MQSKKSEQPCEPVKGSASTSTGNSADDATMIAMYKAKKTLREIGEAVGKSHVTVMNRLKALNVQMRQPGRQCEVDIPRLRKLMRTDATLSEMGFLLTCAPSTVGKLIKKLKAEDLAKSKSNQSA